MIRTDEPVFLGQRLVAYRTNPKKLDARFLLYALQGADLQGQIRALGSGSTVEHMRVPDAKALLVPTPPLATQTRIAEVLSAYDDLIENNIRRIAILEEMARCLFEEALASDQVIAAPLGTLITALESGSRPKGGVSEEGDVPSIGAENISGLANHDFSKEKRISYEFFCAMKRGVVRDGDVLLYKDGAHIGRTAMAWLGYPHEECAVNEHVFLLRPRQGVPSAYLYFYLSRPDVRSAVRLLNTNSAQPGLNQKQVLGIEIDLPDEKVLADFDKVTKPTIDMIFTLAKQQPILRTTRDFLLPKLISGEIEVRAAEEALEVAAA